MNATTLPEMVREHVRANHFIAIDIWLSNSYRDTV